MGEPLVIVAQQLQHRRVKVMNRHPGSFDVVGKLVGLAVNDALWFAPPPAIHIVKQRG